jgi:inner membrane protein
MNAQAHSWAAFITTATVSAAEERRGGVSTLRPVLDGLAGAAFTGLPDKLEPAIHPNHRQFFHSLLVAGVIGYATYKAWQWEPTEDWHKPVRWALLIGGAAYLTHLALDFTTAKSLPVIGKL